MASREITWILFDLGNVLVELRTGGLERAAAALGSTPDRLLALFNEDGIAERIAVGKLSPQDFVEQINRRFGTSIAPADVVSGSARKSAPSFPRRPG